MATMTFNSWRQAMNQDGNFLSGDKEAWAAGIIAAAYESRRMGQLDRKGFVAAVRWGYRVDRWAALSEEFCQRDREEKSA